MLGPDEAFPNPESEFTPKSMFAIPYTANLKPKRKSVLPISKKTFQPRNLPSLSDSFMSAIQEEETTNGMEVDLETSEIMTSEIKAQPSIVFPSTSNSILSHGDKMELDQDPSSNYSSTTTKTNNTIMNNNNNNNNNNININTIASKSRRYGGNRRELTPKEFKLEKIKSMMTGNQIKKLRHRSRKTSSRGKVVKSRK